jgi:hypothetical protein
MGFDLEDYKRITGRLDLDGIDFDVFHDEPLAPEHLRVVRYMHDVEHHTSCYLRNLLNTKAHHDPDITAFLTMWSFEEHWHGEALSAPAPHVSRRCAAGSAGGSRRARSSGWASRPRRSTSWQCT